MHINLDYEDYEVPGFEGVLIKLKALEVQDFQLVFTLIEKLQSADSNGTALMADPETRKVCSEVLPKYCSELRGITLRESGADREATVEDLTKYGDFLTLCVTVLTKLISSSALEEDTKKN